MVIEMEIHWGNYLISAFSFGCPLDWNEKPRSLTPYQQGRIRDCAALMGIQFQSSRRRDRERPRQQNEEGICLLSQCL